MALLIALPHMIQDDGRLLDAFMRRVKGVEPEPGGLLIAVDQSLPLLALFLVALSSATEGDKVLGEPKAADGR